MTKVTIYASCDDNGEWEAAFDSKGRLLSAWSLNDANWRDEYFNHWLRKAGIEIVRVGRITKNMLAQVKESFGW